MGTVHNSFHRDPRVQRVLVFMAKSLIVVDPRARALSVFHLHSLNVRNPRARLLIEEVH
jgi:hypothetical protein